MIAWIGAALAAIGLYQLAVAHDTDVLGDERTRMYIGGLTNAVGIVIAALG